MSKILLIGSNGYIGSALANLLSVHDLTTLDISGNTDLKINYGLLERSEVEKYDTIILLAAGSGVAQCSGHYIHSFNNNLKNFLNLLDIVDNNQKFIYASTASVYGYTPNDTVVNEQYCEFIPSNYYDLTKYTSDCYAKLSGKNYYGLRFGTVNGITKYSNIVRDDLIINAMVKKSMLNLPIDCYNPFVRRGILGLNDLIRAVETVIDSNIEKPGLYNLSSFNTTVGDVARYISNKTGSSINTVYNSDIKYSFHLDSSLFEKTFNFTFNETLESVVEGLIAQFKKCEFVRRNECLII